MNRKVTSEQQRQKDRIDAARVEMRAAIDEHPCFLISDGTSSCWTCNRPYINGQFVNAAFVQAQRPAVQPKKLMTPKECYCEKDQDGECSKCKAVISEMISRMIALGERTFLEFKNLKKEVGNPSCGGCGQQYVDWAIANAFRKVFMRVGSKGLAQEILGGIFKAMSGFGITEAPLTQKAWFDLCQEKHWL
jgi:hypothetical protein